MRKFVIVLIISVLCGCSFRHTDRLTIATAANMQFAMDALTTAFTEQTGVACEVVLGSSGKLTAQITAGAPYDVFVSANLMYPIRLFEQGLAVRQPQVYAHGKLVLWTAQEGVEPSIDLVQHLADNKKLAVANTNVAPYGKAALEVLRHYNLYDKRKDQLVIGESIAQTNQFITTKAVAAGFTAKSVVLAPHIQGKGSWEEVDPISYHPIAQGVLVLKSEEIKQKQGQAFVDFLFSKQGKEILQQFGYAVDLAKDFE